MQEIDYLIIKHKGLLYKQLGRFNLIGNPDAESAGYWALYKALITFKESEHVLISTYATCCIYNALGCYIRTLYKKRKVDTISYNNIICDQIEYGDTLSTNVSVEDVCVEKELVLKTREAINDIYDKMTNEKQRSILKMYVDSEYSASTTYIADKVGVSQSYVSQVLSEFKNKLKRKIGGYYNG